METKLILYHGSNCNFDKVDISRSKDKRDFGKGFYTTTLREQAEDWAGALFDRYKGDGIFIYELVSVHKVGYFADRHCIFSPKGCENALFKVVCL